MLSVIAAMIEIFYTYNLSIQKDTIGQECTYYLNIYLLITIENNSV